MTRSPVKKRKSTDNNSPFVKNASEPINLPSNHNYEEFSQVKRRKIHSLGNLILDSYVTPPHPFKTSPLIKPHQFKTSPLLKSPIKKSQHASHYSCPVESPSTATVSSETRTVPAESCSRLKRLGNHFNVILDKLALKHKLNNKGIQYLDSRQYFLYILKSYRLCLCVCRP